jgi:hypothetical protein
MDAIWYWNRFMYFICIGSGGVAMEAPEAIQTRLIPEETANVRLSSKEHEEIPQKVF